MVDRDVGGTATTIINRQLTMSMLTCAYKQVPEAVLCNAQIARKKPEVFLARGNPKGCSRSRD